MNLSPTGAFARAHDPDRFLCALFAPAEAREAIFALIALNHELARAREAATNPLAAMIRLQWWRDAVEEARAGRPPRRHEVAGPLAAVIAEGGLDPDALIALADAREAEAEEGGLATEEAFVAWLRGTAGGWSAAAGRALGASAEEAETLRGLGAAYGLAGVLRNIPAHAGQGRCLLPLDRLARAGLNAEAVMAAPDAPAVTELRREMAAEGLAALAGARRDLPRGLVAAALPAVLARRDLARLARGGSLPQGRGVGDRLAVIVAGLRGRV
ncbi:squalene/phytoene synthase family protein [Roseomonas sp. JC162]|uniref:Squalene/phytoene synthase family protein n=1 Tax=Neoroseomonas marina TaxID=1232220 RepID=A0A848EFA4_9PROT|nr:squalene/phytoene synthase family protein [Neoroseomonas marina]